MSAYNLTCFIMKVRTQKDESKDHRFSKDFSTLELRVMPDKDRRLILTSVEYVEFRRYLEDCARKNYNND